MSWPTQLSSNLVTIARMMQAVSVIMGVGLVMSALFQFKKYGESRTMMSSQHSIAGPILMFIGGAMLLALPTTVDTALFAFWTNDSPMRYEGGPNGYSAMIPPILIFVRIVGLGSFMRGIVLLARSGGQQSQPGTLSKALIHILGGVLCMHVMGTVNLLETILGIA